MLPSPPGAAAPPPPGATSHSSAAASRAGQSATIATTTSLAAHQAKLQEGLKATVKAALSAPQLLEQQATRDLTNLHQALEAREDALRTPHKARARPGLRKSAR